MFRTKWWNYQTSKAVQTDTSMGCISEYCMHCRAGYTPLLLARSFKRSPTSSPPGQPDLEYAVYQTVASVPFQSSVLAEFVAVNSYWFDSTVEGNLWIDTTAFFNGSKTGSMISDGKGTIKIRRVRSAWYMHSFAP